MKRFRSNDAEETYFITIMMTFFSFMLSVALSVFVVRLMRNIDFFGLPSFLVCTIAIDLIVLAIFLVRFIVLKIFRHIFGF